MRKMRHSCRWCLGYCQQSKRLEQGVILQWRITPCHYRDKEHLAQTYQIMSNAISARFALLTTICMAMLISHSPLSAAAPKERLALMLSGSQCQEAQQMLEPIFRQTEGVFAVDGASVPGHLLLDVEEGKISAQDMLTVAQTTLGTALSCQVDIMRSCITAPKHTGTEASAK